MRKTRRSIVSISALLIILVSTSCLSVKAEIDASDLSEIDVLLQYVVDSELWNLGVFDSETEYRIIPVSRADARRAAVEAGGTLRRYRTKDGGENTTIEITYRLPGVDSLQRLFGGDVTIQNNTLSVLLSPGLSGASEAQIASIEELLGESIVEWTVELPGPIENVEPFGTIEGKRATASLNLQELFLSGDAVYWTVQWESE